MSYNFTQNMGDFDIGYWRAVLDLTKIRGKTLSGSGTAQTGDSTSAINKILGCEIAIFCYTNSTYYILYYCCSFIRKNSTMGMINISETYSSRSTGGNAQQFSYQLETIPTPQSAYDWGFSYGSNKLTLQGKYNSSNSAMKVLIQNASAHCLQSAKIYFV